MKKESGREISVSSSPTSFRDNAFDLIRIVAAGAVLLSHSFPLAGLVEPMVGRNSTLGSFAVWIFFSLSGYLVAASLTHTATLREFAKKRMLRVLPALLVFILLGAFVIGPLLSNLGVSNYFVQPKTWSYLFANPAFGLQSELPGVFEGNIFPLEFNGSMWTIKYELLMYALLASLAGKNLKRNTIVLFLIFLCGNLVHNFDVSNINKVFWRIESFTSFTAERISLLGSIFFSGALVHLIFGRKIPHFIAIASGLLLLAAGGSNAFRPVVAVTLPILVIYIAYNCPAFIRKLAPQSDLSYGVYLWAFTIQQFYASIGLTGQVYWGANLLLSAASTFGIAWLSWHWIEKPALRFKKKSTSELFIDSKSFAKRSR